MLLLGCVLCCFGCLIWGQEDEFVAVKCKIFDLLLNRGGGHHSEVGSYRLLVLYQ
jgi:hypothetical protein